MKTILYTNGFCNTGEKLEVIIHEQLPEINSKVHNSIESLSEVLRQPLNKVSVVVLIISKVDELIHFNSMKMLFDNLRVILILPNRNKETLGFSLKFKTSFISFIDRDLQDVTSVLAQILKKQGEV